ncbi:MAG: hypothetical protein JWN78_1908 [Bacteroidota bacterium]|nr:hypothetical protein [Bacteroidota bacterium]
MGISFRKSMGFGPLRVNLSKSGIGTSVGAKGLRVGIDGKGRAYGSAGIPGTGIYGRKYIAGKTPTTSNVLDEVYERSYINSLGFNYNYDYYRESDNKGCLKIFAWVIGFCLLSIPPVGIAYLLVLFFYQRKRNNEPKNLFRKAFASAFGNISSQQYRIALSFLNKCQQVDPNNSDCLDLSGVCYYQLKEFENAATFFNKANKLNPNSSRIKVLLADSLRNLNTPEYNARLLQLYADINRSNPENDEVKWALGYYMCLDKQYYEAIGTLQKIGADSEMYIQALNGIATCYSELKEYDKGIEVLKLAPLNQKQLDEELKTVHYNLGELYEEKGDKENALKHFNTIEIQDINFMNVRERIKNLSSKP